jgi:steroid delta-isomerase-like uncharacterized protein
MPSHEAQRNRQLLLAAWNAVEGQGRLDAIPEFFADDYVRHSGRATYSREEFATTLRDLHAGFPDLAFRIEETVAEGDRVVFRWTSTGTHQGTFLGAPPTRKRITTSGITISRFAGDRIAEEWASWDKVAVLHELGIIPLEGEDE